MNDTDTYDELDFTRIGDNYETTVEKVRHRYHDASHLNLLTDEGELHAIVFARLSRGTVYLSTDRRTTITIWK